MYLTVTRTERVFNRATRKNEEREYECGRVKLPLEVEDAIRRLAPEYGMSLADVMALALRYYFGDGQDHLACELCGFWSYGACNLPAVGEQTTVPLLDEGTVVVGLPSSDQGV